ncbi:MAG: mechanosensitive ion channel family protein [Bacteroidota bacterium]
MEEFTGYFQFIPELVMKYAPQLLLAIIVLIVGLRVVNRLSDFVMDLMERSGVSKDIRPFLGSFLNIALKVLLLFSVAGIIGIETTSFVAVLAAAGFAVGMALQGSLSNFASGVMILIFRPYQVGDLIEVEDIMGHVEAVQIFNTIIITLENKMVILPNSVAMGGIITNLSAKEYLRVDLNVTMPYGEEFDKVEAIILDALKSTPKVLETPAPFVGIESFDSHSIVLAFRPYSTPEDYWDVYFEANRRVKKAMGEAGIRVAYSEGIELGDIGK